jgi:hypothetical protein
MQNNNSYYFHFIKLSKKVFELGLSIAVSMLLNGGSNIGNGFHLQYHILSWDEKKQC